MVQTGYINIYRSGMWHDAGKPGAFDRHAGDIYPTRTAAEADIAPKAYYVTTVPVQWEEHGETPQVNPADSKPVRCIAKQARVESVGYQASMPDITGYQAAPYNPMIGG